MDRDIADTTTPDVENPAVEAAFSEYLGHWNRLVSTTNWEKGRIIGQWRAALIEAEAPPASYTDEAWSRRVGNVTPQHTGRLRRVYQRFNAVRDQYPGVYWSHYQVALDWEDAEMWLEGAVQNGWSISEMQNQRAATLGALEPPPSAALEVDEDAPAAVESAEAVSGTIAEVRPTEDRDDDSADDAFDATDAVDSGIPFDMPEAEDEPAAVRPFENLPALPADLHEAFEAIKLAIIHHRLARWQEVSCDDVLAALDGLRQLVLAPVE